jgi:hypothetical protein
MRRLALAFTLACVLSSVVRAGEMHPTGVIAPPPPPPSAVMATGEIPTADETSPESSSTLLTIILTVISIVR